MKYRKKPVVIEAIQFTGNNVKDCVEWDRPKYRIAGYVSAEIGQALCIYTLEGKMRAEPGDFLIQGVKGEVYPCKPDIFRSTYELYEITDVLYEPAEESMKRQLNPGEIAERLRDIFYPGRNMNEKVLHEVIELINEIDPQGD